MKLCVCVNANETEDLFTKTAKVKRFQIAGSNFQVNLKGFKKKKPKNWDKAGLMSDHRRRKSTHHLCP